MKIKITYAVLSAISCILFLQACQIEGPSKPTENPSVDIKESRSSERENRKLELSIKNKVDTSNVKYEISGTLWVTQVFPE